MGVCCTKNECVILENSILSNKKCDSENSFDDMIMETSSKINKSNIKIENNENINNIKFNPGPILRLMLQKQFNKVELNNDKDLNGSTDIVKV